MDLSGLFAFAVSYIALQTFSIFHLKGAWLRAAVLPVPVLCAILILSVSAGLFGVNGAEIGAIAAVPLGLVYLVALLAMGEITRFFRSLAG